MHGVWCGVGVSKASNQVRSASSVDSLGLTVVSGELGQAAADLLPGKLGELDFMGTKTKQ